MDEVQQEKMAGGRVQSHESHVRVTAGTGEISRKGLDQGYQDDLEGHARGGRHPLQRIQNCRYHCWQIGKGLCSLRAKGHRDQDVLMHILGNAVSGAQVGIQWRRVSAIDLICIHE
jgi:hypothetical protein